MFGNDRVHVCIPGMLTRFTTLPEEEGWGGSGMTNRHKVCTWTQWRRAVLQLSPLHHLPIAATWNTGAPNTEHPPFRASGTPTPLPRPLTTQLLHNPSLGSCWPFLPPYDRLRLLDMFSKTRGKFATRRTRKPESAGSLSPLNFYSPFCSSRS